jgi:hypothetical protein
MSECFETSSCDEICGGLTRLRTAAGESSTAETRDGFRTVDFSRAARAGARTGSTVAAESGLAVVGERSVDPGINVHLRKMAAGGRSPGTLFSVRAIR